MQEALALVRAGAFIATKRLNKKYREVFFIIDNKMFKAVAAIIMPDEDIR
ncbi:MAG: hypothetical protein K2N11_08330 [Mucispirillum sp.]|nr:hypothetical protein [Mucispirillum sp.]